MTEWRDARLGKALDHAPDAEQRPQPETRAAVLRHAREALAQTAEAAAGSVDTAARAPAVADATRRPWWRRLLGESSSSRMPWNAAFASLLLAGVVTLVWREQEVPGALVDDPVIGAPERTAPKTSATPAAPAADADAAAAPARARPPADTPSAGVAADAALPAPKPGPAAKPPAEAPPATALRRSAPPPQRDEAPTAEPAKKAEANVAESAPAPAPVPAPAPAPAPPPVPAPVAVPAPAPMQSQVLPPGLAAPAAPAAAARAPAYAPSPVAPAAPAAAAAAAPPPALRDDARDTQRAGGNLAGRVAPPRAEGESAAAPASASAAIDRWTQARVLLADRVLVLPRVQAGAIADGIRVMLSAATGTQPFAEAAVLRIELSRDGQDLAVLELGDTMVRWTLLKPGSVSSFTGRPDPAQLRALRDAIERR